MESALQYRQWSSFAPVKCCKMLTIVSQLLALKLRYTSRIIRSMFIYARRTLHSDVRVPLVSADHRLLHRAGVIASTEKPLPPTDRRLPETAASVRLYFRRLSLSSSPFVIVVDVAARDSDQTENGASLSCVCGHRHSDLPHCIGGIEELCNLS